MKANELKNVIEAYIHTRIDDLEKIEDDCISKEEGSLISSRVDEYHFAGCKITELNSLKEFIKYIEL